MKVGNLELSSNIKYLLSIPAYSCSGCKERCLKLANDCPDNKGIKFILTGFYDDYREIAIVQHDYKLASLYIDSTDYFMQYSTNTQHPTLLRIANKHIVENISLDVKNTEKVVEMLNMHCK